MTSKSHKLTTFYKNIKNAPSFKEFLQSNSLNPPTEVYSENRLPEWLKTTIPCGGEYSEIKKSLRKARLSTVCEEARCPNITECWNTSDGNVATATIMIMGDTCTRACRFCSVKTSPRPNALDSDEPENVAKIVSGWPIDYIVITSVDRDDLEDAGSKHIAKTIKLVKHHKPEMMVECLVPDFSGKESSIQDIVHSGLDVYAHNIETVESLQRHVRDYRANYEQSMFNLKFAKEYAKKIERKRKLVTKTSIMLGLGETDDEVYQTLHDLRLNDVDIVTLGQYVRPTKRHLKVREYVSKEKFEFWKKIGFELGFLYVASGPLIRSSYRAGEIYIKNILKRLE